MNRLLLKWPSQRALWWACIWGLLALVVTAWSILDPKPILVVAGMSVAQGLGGLAFLLFIVSVIAEYRRDTGQLPPSDAAPRSPEAP